MHLLSCRAMTGLLVQNSSKEAPELDALACRSGGDNVLHFSRRSDNNFLLLGLPNDGDIAKKEEET